MNFNTLNLKTQLENNISVIRLITKLYTFATVVLFFFFLLPNSIYSICIDDLDNLTDCQCIAGNCKSGKGTLRCIYNETVGLDLKLTFQNGKWEGPGEYQLVDSEFKGNFKNNKISGNGRYLEKNSSGILEREYEGEWKNNCSHGRGLWKGIYGNYEGGFSEGFFNGKGTFTFKTGEDFSGQFFNGWICTKGDCKNGKGEAINPYNSPYAEAKRYSGDFKNGKMHGNGIYITTKFRWEGGIVNNEISGKGILYYSDGTKFVGSFKNGDPQKGGKYFKLDGSVDIERTDELE